MKNLLLACLACLCMLLGHSPTSVYAQGALDQRIGELSKQISDGLTENQKQTIAVVEFVDLEGRVTNFGRFVAEELITRLYQTKKFKVIERQLLNKIVAEQKLSLGGMIDQSSAQKLGKLLGVDAIASGTVTDLGKSLRVNARLISTGTGEIFAVAVTEIAKDDSVMALMGAISTPGGSEGTKATAPTARFKTTFKTVTVSLDSLRVLSDGSVVVTLRFLNSGTKELLAALDVQTRNVYVTDDAGNRYDFGSSTSMGQAHFINIRRGSNGWLTCPPSSEVTASITFKPPRNMEKRGNTFSTSIPVHVGTFYIDGFNYTRVTEDGNFDIYFRNVSPM
jgi:TolB-like protein